MMNLDAELFLWLNFDGGYWSDQLFSGISSRFFAIPLYLILIWQLWKRYGKKTGILLIAVALLIAVSDQTSVFVKNHVQRLRPCHTEALQSEIHLVDGKCGGTYGYYSSHASNTAALAVFCTGLLGMSPLLRVVWLWVILVGYARIYLGAHYPGDVLSGWIAGALLALLFLKFLPRIIKPLPA